METTPAQNGQSGGGKIQLVNCVLRTAGPPLSSLGTGLREKKLMSVRAAACWVSCSLSSEHQGAAQGVANVLFVSRRASEKWTPARCQEVGWDVCMAQGILGKGTGGVANCQLTKVVSEMATVPWKEKQKEVRHMQKWGTLKYAEVLAVAAERQF